MKHSISTILIASFLLTCCSGNSQNIKVAEKVAPRVPASICKSFTDNHDGKKKSTWCEYFNNPQSHLCTEVTVDGESTITKYYFDESLPQNSLVEINDIPYQKGGLVAEYVQEKDSEAILSFNAYVYANNNWRVAATSTGRLFDGMGENSFYLSSGMFMSAGENPADINKTIVWTVNDSATTFSISVDGKPIFANSRDENGGFDKEYYEDTGIIKSETKYKAVKDYDRLFGEEFIRYEVLEKTEY